MTDDEKNFTDNVQFHLVRFFEENFPKLCSWIDDMVNSGISAYEVEHIIKKTDVQSYVYESAYYYALKRIKERDE